MTDTAPAGMMTEEEFLAHMNMTDEEYLEHYGKKGMKWGQRTADYALGVAGKSRNARANGGTRNDNIDAARGRRATGENKRNLKEAKIQYKSAKKTEGAAAAKAALRAVKDKNADDEHDARLAKSGKEAVGVALLTTAAIALQFVR